MDGSKPPSISPQDLYGAIGTDGAPILIDVRRGAAFAADNRMIVGAIRRSPDEIQNWRPQLTSGRAVVVYCVHGREVSQDTASALRGAGVEARYLEHGMVMYDAFYAWCRSLQGETHNWTPPPSA